MNDIHGKFIFITYIPYVLIFLLKSIFKNQHFSQDQLNQGVNTSSVRYARILLIPKIQHRTVSSNPKSDKTRKRLENLKHIFCCVVRDLKG